MGRKPNTDSRRQQIVAALLEEISVTGYERASTKSIAARAGLAPGLIHYHFKSKEEILLALVDMLIALAEASFTDAIKRAESASEKLAAFVASRVGLGPTFDSAAVKAWVSILAESMGQIGVRDRVAHWLGRDHVRLARLFKEAGSSQPKEQASLLLALILGSFTLHAINVSGVSKDYAERNIQDWLKSVINSGVIQTR